MIAMTTSLGPFVAGEKPFPLVVSFTDDAGQPLALTGMVGRFSFRVGDGPASVLAADVNAAGGTATYEWQDADLANPGLYSGEMWVGTAAGVKLASVRYSWRVRPALAAITWPA